MVSNKIYISIIPARGGSKGIKKKNMYPVLGKPLLYWTLKSSLESKSISQTWVTSDDVEILDFAKQNGANIIKRPQSLSKDFCTSESAWSHAIQYISKNGINFTEVVGLQATSPIRENNDIDKAILHFEKLRADSLFSGCPITDHLLWKKNLYGKLVPINYNGGERKPRQKIIKKYLENGSIYIFNKDKFNKENIRLFGNIGIYEMNNYKSLQIDELSDVKFCEAVMKHFYNLG